MATLAVISAALTGTTLVQTAAAGGGDQFANPKGNAFLYVKNASGSSMNVTLTAQTTSRPAEGPYPSQSVANNVVAVGAGLEKLIGPIPSAFNDGNGNVQVSYSLATSVTVQPIQP